MSRLNPVRVQIKVLRHIIISLNKPHLHSSFPRFGHHRNQSSPLCQEILIGLLKDFRLRLFVEGLGQKRGSVLRPGPGSVGLRVLHR